MAFAPPTFNLTVAIWRSTTVNYLTPDIVTVGNLAYGRRNQPSVNASESQMSLLLPSHTDIRGGWNGGQPDIVEAPAGSKRFYVVGNVDDSGKGFANEHRIATLTQEVFGFFGFPQPVPLP